MNDNLIESVVEAFKGLSGSVDKAEKERSGKYLEDFQKSTEAWTVIHNVLSDTSGRYTLELKVFCAQTLKSKVSYDLHQIPEDSRISLKNSIIDLLKLYISGPRIICVQLSISLANMALHMLEWKGVVSEMTSIFGSINEGIPSLLEFLKILPEELSNPHTSALTDEELASRGEELVGNNADEVVQLLLNYVQRPESNANKPLVFECLNSWLSEIEIGKIIGSPLLDIVFQALDDSDCYDPAIECICSMIRDTRDVFENMRVIEQLYPRVIGLRTKLAEARDDPDLYTGYTRLFAEAGESWHMLIAQSPKQFRPLVEAIAECTAMDEDLEVVQYTFYFWYSLKQMIVLEKYNEARQELGDIYLKLISVIINHLHYPKGSMGGVTAPNEDMFGNKEEEDKFRSFRHEIGDILKDCCAVVGSTIALQEVLKSLQSSLQAMSSWQDIEAPVFSLRVMGREVDAHENVVMPQIMALLIQLPEHEKIRYAATLVIGRYTEWTANHPEFLEAQLQYVIQGFESNDKDTVSAAAQALMHFCQDCADLMVKYIDRFHSFYLKVAGVIDMAALYEVTDGIAHIVLAQEPENVLSCLQPFCAPIVQNLYQKANNTSLPAGSEALNLLQKSIADEIEILTIFVRVLKLNGRRPNPISPFVIEIYPLIDTILNNHGTSTMVAERTSKLIKYSLHSCGVGLEPILGTIAETLANQFARTHMGCYLWVSGALLREFSDDVLEPFVTAEMKKSVWSFSYQQMSNFFRHLSELTDPTEIPDLVEDFFRMCEDVLMFYAVDLCTSDLLTPCYQAALLALSLTEYNPLVATIHFLQDFFAFVLDKPTNSHTGPKDEQGQLRSRKAVEHLIVDSNGGEELLARILAGIISTFPAECANEAGNLLVYLMQIPPKGSGQFELWLSTNLDNLPPNTVGEVERRKLMDKCSVSLASGDYKRVKSAIRDFCTMYARRTITPRSEFSSLKVSKNFHFSG